MAKNLISGSILAHLDQICSLFGGFYLYQILAIVTSYPHIQFQGKLLIQTQENGLFHFSLKSHPHDSGYLFNQKDKYFLEDEVSLRTVSSCSDILY